MCHSQGIIVNTVKQIINSFEKPVTLVVPMSDGYSSDPNQGIARKSREEFESNITNPDTIVGLLCTRNFTDPRAFLMPLDDETFERGLIDLVSRRTSLPPWEERKSIAFWRGGVSGGTYPTIRTRLVELMCDYPYSDFKFVPTPESYLRTGPMDMNDKRMFDEDRHINYQVYFKYILILDGACIASAHQWVFASGSVPIMVSHPNNNYWFKKYLKPMVHYVPINYDLSDLKEKIEWLRDNDEEAKQISQNATQFALTILSPEFQRGYLYEEVVKLIQ
jgi:hypothetical protein